MDDRRSLAAMGYLEAKVRGASPAELVSLLYQGLAARLHAAGAALERGDVAGKGSAILRCLDILAHLRASLNHEAGGEVAQNFERLYAYWTRRLTEANVTSRGEPLAEILTQLESVRLAWNEGVLAAGSGTSREAAAPVLELATAAGR